MLFLLLLVTALVFAANTGGPSAQSAAWPGGDPTVKPGTDIFLFANGGWLNENPIPADRVGFSNATLLSLSAADRVRTLLEESAVNAGEEPAIERGKVGAYYAAFMDQPRTEALGAAPLQRSLLEIRQARSRNELVRLMGAPTAAFRVPCSGCGSNRTAAKRWTLTPQTVNAYNYAPFNEVVFTAALLQPPAFDPTQDSAVTYGGIGAIIGHELTHSFDDVGRRFDATGHRRDWWTASDHAHFAAKAEELVALFSACEAAPGVRVDGHLTLGENIADIGGLQLAFAAYHASFHGHPAGVINGLTGDQRFFLGFAKLRRGHRRPQALRDDVASDPHTPDACRVNEDVRNVDGWYDAFGVMPESPLFLQRELRIRIW